MCGKRVANPEYSALGYRLSLLRQEIDNVGKSDPEKVKKLRQKIKVLDQARKKLPYIKPGVVYRRLRYIRYADDFLIGVIGCKNDAQTIAQKVKAFLKNELLLDVAKEKSGVYHGSKGTHFLAIRKLCTQQPVYDSCGKTQSICKTDTASNEARQ